jgi:uncharacterized protein YxeA
MMVIVLIVLAIVLAIVLVVMFVLDRFRPVLARDGNCHKNQKLTVNCHQVW